jgi:hypothetical protein
MASRRTRLSRSQRLQRNDNCGPISATFGTTLSAVYQNLPWDDFEVKPGGRPGEMVQSGSNSSNEDGKDPTHSVWKLEKVDLVDSLKMEWRAVDICMMIRC